ncbi:binding partner of ACD11 1-like [Hibiscus syriacus]|uniref:binding partner of ACD11 1-like n=1 Tax=Hibiscus syriacus TaxID=106335 RepID=UPI001922D64D|nr:binding partner of ACD11 1-like [Hibiscus syriacus]
MIFLRHHLHEGLKTEYLTVKDSQIIWINLKESETIQLKTAYVTFKDPKALEIALLLSGATLIDKIVTIISAENYVPKFEIHESRAADDLMSVSPAGHSASNDEQGRMSPPSSGRMYVSRAQNVVASVLAKVSAIRQDAVNKAKAFDEKHQLRTSASTKVISFDWRVGLTEKLTVGISAVNEKVKSVDQRLQVSDKTMAAIFAAEETKHTGSAVKSSRYDFSFQHGCKSSHTASKTITRGKKGSPSF